MSQIIQIVTQSRWSHSALCVGRPDDFRQYLPIDFDPKTRGPSNVYLVEAELGRGTVLTEISHYEGFRLRLCRPSDLSPEDQGHLPYKRVLIDKRAETFLRK